MQNAKQKLYFQYVRFFFNSKRKFNEFSSFIARKKTMKVSDKANLILGIAPPSNLSLPLPSADANFLYGRARDSGHSRDAFDNIRKGGVSSVIPEPEVDRLHGLVDRLQNLHPTSVDRSLKS